MLELLFEIVQSLALVVFYCLQTLLGLVWPQRRSLKDEVALITGAGSGIGRLMALRLSELGAVVVLWDLNEAGVQAVAKEVRAKGGRAFAYAVDVTNSELVYATAKKVEEEAGPVNILINNAGIVTGKKLLECPDALMRKTVEVNSISHFWTVKAFLPAMLAANHGHIVTIASAAGLAGTPGLVDYCASKFAAVGFDESLRQELARLGKTGVKTLCVCPFFIKTGMFDGAKSKFPLLLPLLEPEYVANKVVEGIQTDQQVLIMPYAVNLTFILRAILPSKALDECARLLGMHEAMDDFKGRKAH